MVTTTNHTKGCAYWAWSREDGHPQCNCGAAARDQSTVTPSPGVVSLAGVAPERVSWLWPGRLPVSQETRTALSERA